MDQLPRKRLYPGLKILCPSCRRVMAIVRKEMVPGDTFTSDKFEAVEAVLTKGAAMRCPYDNTDYAVGGAKSNIYVAGYEGWV
jgi:hypothetical protein